MRIDDANHKFNVLYRGMALSGGAPKSAYYYLSYFKKRGAYITTLNSVVETKIYNLYLNSFDRVIVCDNPVSLINNHRFFKLYILMKNEYKFLKKNKPDLVIIQGHLNALFYAPMCNCLNIKNIMLIAGGDLSKSSLLLNGNSTDHVVCYSKENEDELLKYFDKKRVSVISNRIEVQDKFDDIETHYNFENEKSIKFLLTSRITNDKYASIISFLDVLNKVNNNNYKITLTIVGGGNLLDKLKVDVLRYLKSDLNIIVKGHVDDLLSEFKKAHIVVGKGRSVIEPIMLNRIGCVISDDGLIEVCASDNIERLYHYNFAGRHLLKENATNLIEELIASLLNNEYDLSQIFQNSLKLDELYSVGLFDEKFSNVMDNIEYNPHRFRYVSVLALMLKLLVLKFKQRKVN